MNFMSSQASFAGNAAEVKRLIDNGVPPDSHDYDGRTALVLNCWLELGRKKITLNAACR